MPRLTEQEQQEIIRFLEAVKPLPKTYRSLPIFFADKGEMLTKIRTDWIEYWTVDFNFEGKREIIRLKKINSHRDAEAQRNLSKGRKSHQEK